MDVPGDLPLLRFDPTGEALIAPSAPTLSEPWPRRLVLCFFHEQIAALRARGGARLVGRFSAEMGGHGIHLVDAADGGPVVVFHPGVGAPAAVHHLERAVAGGARDVVVCGSGAALVPGLARGHAVVVTGAIRDEGTSFHYAAPASRIEVDRRVVDALTALLAERSVPHAAGLAWTTDAPFRETPTRVATRSGRRARTAVGYPTASFASAGSSGSVPVWIIPAGANTCST